MYIKVHRKNTPDSEFEIVRGSKAELLIMQSIGAESLYGYQLFKKTFGKLKLNSLYVQLPRMVKKGMLVPHAEERVGNRLPKILYTNIFDSYEMCD